MNVYDRKLLVELCKKNAPSIYQTVVVKKINIYKEELNNLRAQYANETDLEKKESIKKKANYIKSELAIYE